MTMTYMIESLSKNKIRLSTDNILHCIYIINQECML